MSLVTPTIASITDLKIEAAILEEAEKVENHLHPKLLQLINLKN